MVTAAAVRATVRRVGGLAGCGDGRLHGREYTGAFSNAAGGGFDSRRLQSKRAGRDAAQDREEARLAPRGPRAKKISFGGRIFFDAAPAQRPLDAAAREASTFETRRSDPCHRVLEVVLRDAEGELP